MARPSFALAWKAFQDVRIPVADVGRLIGGKVQQNIDAGIFQNACPIRMSYVLNKTGFPIPAGTKYAAVTGADKQRYMFRVNDMMEYLESKFGRPEKSAKSPRPSDFAGMNGILLVKGSGWQNARGHVTLWNGSLCADSCHLAQDPDNGTFIPEVASLWTLR